jgi:hypothetical protein
MGDGVQGGQDIEALPTTGSLDKDAREAPEKAQERLQDEMSSIDKEEVTETGFGFIQAGFELFFRKSACASGSALAGICPTLRRFMPNRRR